MVDPSERETSTETPGAQKRKQLEAVMFTFHALGDETSRADAERRFAWAAEADREIQRSKELGRCIPYKNVVTLLVANSRI